MNRLEHISTNRDVKMDVEDDSVKRGDSRNVTEALWFKYRDSISVINTNQVLIAYTEIRIMQELKIWTFNNFDSDFLL